MFSSSHAFSGYSVSDTSETINFYSEVLRLIVEETPMGLGLKFPNGHSVLLYQKDDHVPATFTVLNFPVENIDIAVDELSLKGVAMQRYDNFPAPQDEKGIVRGKAAGMGPDIAWFKDPSGNVLAVLQN